MDLSPTRQETSLLQGQRRLNLEPKQHSGVSSLSKSEIIIIINIIIIIIII